MVSYVFYDNNKLSKRKLVLPKLQKGLENEVDISTLRYFRNPKQVGVYQLLEINDWEIKVYAAGEGAKKEHSGANLRTCL